MALRIMGAPICRSAEIKGDRHGKTGKKDNGAVDDHDFAWAALRFGHGRHEL